MTAVYTLDSSTGVWRRPEHTAWRYSDGEAVEYRLLRAVLAAGDVSVCSEELRRQITDWPSAYHLSAARANLIRHLPIGPTTRVLELGSGCGAITRYLGECGAEVCAVEGSPLRARIGAARCRDLPNVRVHCDDFARFESDSPYDIVTLIGVLEYAPVFFPDQDPVDACLRLAERFLAPDGMLIVAIENQLGLKYLAGAPEDHVAKSHFGVNGLYERGTPVTFGRRELLERLARAGFPNASVYLPFPDYKLPGVVVSPSALDHPQLRLGDLLARSLVKGRDDPGLAVLHPPLAWQVVTRNGLAAELANSFLVVARRQPPAAVDGDPVLARAYSTSRRRRFMTETRFIADGASLGVRKRPLFACAASDAQASAGNGRFMHRPGDAAYLEGELLAFGLWRLVASGAPPEDIGAWAQPWVDALRMRALAAGAAADALLPGNAIDWTPFNTVRTPDGNLHFIDDEWASAEPVPLLWVVIRGLVFSIYGYPVHESLARLTFRQLLDAILDRLSLPRERAAVDAAWRWESAFQTFCVDRSRWLNFDSLLDQPIAQASPGLRDMQRTLDEHARLGEQVRSLTARLDRLERSPLVRALTLARNLACRVLRHGRRALHLGWQSLRLARASVLLAWRLLRQGTLGSQASRLAATWRLYGFRGLEALARDVLTRNADYRAWVARHDTLSEDCRSRIAAHVDLLPYRPRISIVMPVFNAPERWLRRAVESVREQLYPDWELCIADDASTAAWVRPCLEELAAADPRIRTVLRSANGHISAASNSALALASGEFVALLDHDDELPPHALYAVAAALNENRELDVIYSDEDKIDEQGARFDAYFKPDWNPDLLLGQNMISHLGVYRRSLVEAVGGFREGYEGSQDWDLALRVVERTRAERIHHIPRVLYHWRTVSGSTSTGHEQKGYVLAASRRLLEDHLARQGRAGDVLDAGGSHFRVRYRLPESPPRVCIVIPTRNRHDLLRQCIDSVYARTRYPDFSILVVDNQSDDPAALDYFRALQQEGRARVVAYDRPFNFSAIVNFGARHADGELLCLMNNDIEVIGEDWLAEMASHALRDGVAAVGAMLYYPNDAIQHAGIALGLGGVAGHFYAHCPRGDRGYFNRARLVQNLSAVTAACMVLRRSVFDEVGGFDEQNLPVAFNDVDFCLRLRERGYRNVWTPYAELYHHESASRGDDDTPEKQARFAGEVAYMRARWGEWLDSDPAHNPNLSLQHSRPRLAAAPRGEPLC